MTSTHAAKITTTTDLANALGYLDQRMTVRLARHHLFASVDTEQGHDLRRVLFDVGSQDDVTVGDLAAHLRLNEVDDLGAFLRLI